MALLSEAQLATLAEVTREVGAAPWVPFDATQAEKLAPLAVACGFTGTDGEFLEQIQKNPILTLLRWGEFVVTAGGPAVPVAAAPAITDAIFSLGTTTEGFFDIQLTLFYDGSNPLFPHAGASLEIWRSKGAGPFTLIGTMGTEDQFYFDLNVQQDETSVQYKARYTKDGIPGEFSAITTVDPIL